jgi:hypothetical protein
VLLQLGARPGERDATDLEHVRRLCGLKRNVRVLLDDEDGQAFLLVQLSDDSEDLRDEEGREAERRLVEQQQPGPLHECARQREHLLLAAAECPCLLAAPLFEPRKEGLDAREVVLRRAARIRAKAEVLPDGQLRERAAALRDVGDPEACDGVGPESAQPRPCEEQLAVAADTARDRAQRRGLARAVRSEHGGDLALLDGERDPVQRLNGAVAGGHVA